VYLHLGARFVVRHGAAEKPRVKCVKECSSELLVTATPSLRPRQGWTSYTHPHSGRVLSSGRVLQRNGCPESVGKTIVERGEKEFRSRANVKLVRNLSATHTHAGTRNFTNGERYPRMISIISHRASCRIIHFRCSIFFYLFFFYEVSPIVELIDGKIFVLGTQVKIVNCKFIFVINNFQKYKIIDLNTIARCF
jgi:hypothetical protein